MFDTLLESRHTVLSLPRWGVAVAVGLHAAVVGAVLRPAPPREVQPVVFGTELLPFVEPSSPPLIDPGGLVVPGPTHFDLPPIPSPLPIPGLPAVGVPAPGLPATPAAGPPGPGWIGNTDAVPEALVEHPPELLVAPVPPYPARLRAAGVVGHVLVEVVVDTTGRPEPGSLRVVQSSNAGFDAAAVATIRAALFRPGRVWGRAVRVLVRVPVEFRLRPPS
ncbi:MAG TPA: TonB family protein [Gemmatimonadales bacterium]|nr:TonB family protein [Gemmatimonadales bacterium]